MAAFLGCCASHRSVKQMNHLKTKYTVSQLLMFFCCYSVIRFL